MGWKVDEKLKLFILILFLNLIHMLLGLAATFQQITNPRIVEHPEDQYVGRNEPATINCKAEGDPPAIISWYRNGEAVITANDNPLSHRMLLPSGQLFFLRIIHNKNSRSDIGMYYCNATNPLTGVSSISRNASLLIAMIRDEFREQPLNTDAALGDSTTLQCRPPRGDPEPKILWKKDGEPVAVNDRVYVKEDGSLYISDLKKDDIGLYSCLAHNIGGQRESKPARLVVLEKPKILEAPTDFVVSENGDVLFKCQGTGDPEPITVWKRQKGIIPAQRSKILDNRSLKIKKVKVQDEGVYICRVENSIGWQEAEARLSVHVQPSIITLPRSKSISVGRRVSLECEAAGNPVPAIFWKKENRPMLMFPGQSYSRFSVQDDGTLIIEQVEKDDADQYICQAQSIAGSAIAKAEITVKEMDSRPPPIIRHGLQNQTLPINSLASLQCIVSGYPLPNVRWFKNSRILNIKDQRFTLLESGTLQIAELRRTDSGWYTCKAISETGETSWSGALVVEAPTNPSIIFRRTPEPSTYPGPPSKPQVTDVKETSVRLSWKPSPNQGASQISSYVVEYFSHETGESWFVASDSITENSYTVVDLRPNTSYRFLVRAQNSHGTSLPSQVTGIIKTRGGEDLLSQDLLSSEIISSKLSIQVVHLAEPEAITSKDILLQWEVRKNEGYVEGFHIKYCTVQSSDFGHDIPPAAFAIQTIQNAETRSHMLHDLQENTLYMIFLQPYYQLTDGAASNTIYAQTLEDVPSFAPMNIKAFMRDNETLHLSWLPPPKQHHNGILTGYKIYLCANDSQFKSIQDIWANISTTEIFIQNLPRHVAFHVQIAAHTKIGEGVRSEDILIGHSWQELGETVKQQSPWMVAIFIISVGGSLWLVMCVVIICLYKRRSKKNSKFTDTRKKQLGIVSEPTLKDEKLVQHLTENIYENISSTGANSTTKTIYDGSSIASNDQVAAAAAAAAAGAGEGGGRCPLASDLESFYQAYIIKPKPPGNRCEGSETTKITSTANHHHHQPNVFSTNYVYPSLNRDTNDLFVFTNQNLFSRSIVPYPDFSDHQMSPVSINSDSSEHWCGSTDDINNKALQRNAVNYEKNESYVVDRKEKMSFEEDEVHLRYSSFENAASQPEPFPSDKFDQVSKKEAEAVHGTTCYSDTEELMRRSYYQTPPSPAPKDYQLMTMSH